ncbi:hypothetical protein V6N11_039870 [Hibiscus sabdariffa]|uniref:Uncharacterized protein n=1 Tax=Hibiscus sabdariffa TaxID=183260 RepID=A0ABR2RFR8_9ROSI
MTTWVRTPPVEISAARLSHHHHPTPSLGPAPSPSLSPLLNKTVPATPYGGGHNYLLLIGTRKFCRHHHTEAACIICLLIDTSKFVYPTRS